MTQRTDASERQVRAADPALSTWLSANAGSGKTRVLTDRVARLLLAGVDPGQILCLTYTKAAASEMQNRLFKRLGEWAMKEDAALRVALSDLGVPGGVAGLNLSRARQLFARAIETPGGLRIQTIHSFCASLLRRFPLEAGVSPQFTEMDDRAAKLLRNQILDDLADGLAPEAMATLARAYTGEDFVALADEVAGQRGDFSRFLSEADCRALFGLPDGVTEQTLLADVFLGGEAEWLPQVAAVLAGGSTNDVRAAEKLGKINLAAPDLKAVAGLEGVLLFGTSKVPGKSYTAKIGAVGTKATQANLAGWEPRLDALALRVEAARTLRLALAAARRSHALHQFAAAFLPEYAARKAARGFLDFDDLILRAKALLTDRSVAQWVLYRLDGGIDHILVDEAQDTSPDQWDVIDLLTAEFTAGEGARGTGRTIFVVGDKKQSIYSFQGADVAAFDDKRTHFSAKLAEVNQPLQQMQLEHSFRSAPLILRLVDLTFDERRHRDVGGEVRHIAFNSDLPGRIDLWPPFEKADAPDPGDWFAPVDLITEEHHATRLARRIARTIRNTLESGTQITTKDGTRPVHAGDFLILVRRRSDIFAEIIRACKAEGLPIAGADRLKLGAELAVKDLAALLSFLATPEDDLSLAACLRSPLLGWTEAQLFALAHGRKGFLWEALRNQSAVHGDTLAMLQDLRNQADFLRPYDLIERVLTRHDGRRKLLARLGDEAEDGIDELLSQALAYERDAVPSLTGFLGWLVTDDIDVKRQMDSAGARIRVMTVHGAKGLEAPIVILPDTAQARKRERDEIYLLPQNIPVWKTPADESPEAITAARDARRARDEAEAMRLLYVAMTRAQSWLIVATAGDLGKDKDEDAPQMVWYRMIRDAMDAMGATPAPDGGLSLCEGVWPAPLAGLRPEPLPQAVLPDWISRSAPDALRRPQPLNPSQLGGAKALPGETAPDDDNRDVMDRGTRLHLLLEHLPQHDPAQWTQLADSLLGAATDTPALLAEAAGVVQNPRLAALFAPGTLAEVDVSATLLDRQMSGTIDRLIVTPDRVLAVDFKSNTRVPPSVADVPEGLLRQMGAYHSALCQIYPDRRIDVALLWTATATLMPLDADILRVAVAGTTLP